MASPPPSGISQRVRRGDRADQPAAHRSRGNLAVLGAVASLSMALATTVAVLVLLPSDVPAGGTEAPVITPTPGTVQEEIVTAARAELGTEEAGDGCQKYSDQCVPWCALFAMSTWERAGVDVDSDEFAFTGNVYTTGRAEGTAYDSKQLEHVRPGDVLLFGTGPQTPASSRHIGVVERIQGNTVTLIEGNTGDNPDRVMRKEHRISEGTFYGGVRPW